MAQPNHHAAIEGTLELLNQSGSDSLREAFHILLNAAMLLERQQFLNAEPYQRIPQRRDYANGTKPKHLRMRVGELELRIPQVRNSRLHPSVVNNHANWLFRTFGATGFSVNRFLPL